MTRRRERCRRPAVAVIDCDVHANVPSIDALFPWLDAHWREVAATTQFRGPDRHGLSAERGHAACAPTSPALTASPAPSRDLRARVLDPWDVEAAILDCAYGTEAVKNPDAAAALRRAVNGWLVAEWLERGAAAARLDRRARAGAAGRRPTRSTARRSIPASSRCCCRCARSRPTATASGGRCSRRRDAPRPGARAALRRRARPPADVGRLADDLPRGVRRHGPAPSRRS